MSKWLLVRYTWYGLICASPLPPCFHMRDHAPHRYISALHAYTMIHTRIHAHTCTYMHALHAKETRARENTNTHIMHWTHDNPQRRCRRCELRDRKKTSPGRSVSSRIQRRLPRRRNTNYCRMPPLLLNLVVRKARAKNAPHSSALCSFLCSDSRYPTSTLANACFANASSVPSLTTSETYPCDVVESKRGSSA